MGLARTTKRFKAASRVYGSLGSLMLLVRLAVRLEPLNALDPTHRSSRAAPLSRMEFAFAESAETDVVVQFHTWRN
jgi:hypothetical protein